MTSMTTTPLVTIAIPCYNHEQYVQDSIQSIIDQSYSNIELIIIDDGSKDNSVLKIQELISICINRFSRFEFRYRENKGLCNTLNEALKWANGEYFCTLASDDMIQPEKIELQIQALREYPEAIACFGGVNIIDKHNKIIDQRVRSFKKTCFSEIFLNQHDLPASSQMIDTATLQTVGGFNPQTKIEDWDLLLRLSNLDKEIIYIPYPLVNYRSHDENMSKNQDMMYEEMLKIAMQYRDHKLYPSAVYTIQKIIKIRPLRKESPIKSLMLRCKYYLIYLQNRYFSKQS
ncbi:glycosyltransferase [Acinetobacter sp. ANC5681]|jgi:alpha-1,3-rhamnosyltransferase|uniref:glycosyltransferase family 2 protein n=1 Tax=Acinetobacter sp. ANC5681 TaxID=2929504 RepID=UPI00201B0CC4|nr:glycosyltransferase [Acinetobacter sp. ANC5681]MCL5768205.1 glycosyltransferase [Acinetobacter sp. ANC5681]